MILILSEKNDRSTHDVIDWLESMNKQYLVIYSDAKLESFNVVLTNNALDFVLNFKNKTVRLSEIEAYWYRRGYLNHWFRLLEKNSRFYKKINTHLVSEWKIVHDTLCKILESKPSIGSWDANKSSNKVKT